MEAGRKCVPFHCPHVSEGLSAEIVVDFVDVEFVTATGTCETCQLLVCMNKIHKVWWCSVVAKSVNICKSSLITPGVSSS